MLGINSFKVIFYNYKKNYKTMGKLAENTKLRESQVLKNKQAITEKFTTEIFTMNRFQITVVLSAVWKAFCVAVSGTIYFWAHRIFFLLQYHELPWEKIVLCHHIASLVSMFLTNDEEVQQSPFICLF